jgi:hypothetical protein
MPPSYLRYLLPRPIHVLLSLRVPELRLLRISLCFCHEHVLTRSLYEYYLAAKEHEKAQKLASQKKVAEAQAASRAANRAISPTQKSPNAAKSPKKAGTATGPATPKRKSSDSTALEQRNIDVSGLGLGVEEKSPVQEEPPRMALAREKALEEATKALEAERKGQAGVSLVVIGESGV